MTQTVWRVPIATLIVMPLIGCSTSLDKPRMWQPMQSGDGSNTRAASLGATQVSSQTKATANTFRSLGKPGHKAYLIGPLDTLDISVFKVPELSKRVQVAAVGTISLPLVGEVKAADRTARDIELELTRKLGADYIQRPQVIVLVREYNSQRVTLEGAVKAPGVYPIKGSMSLLQLIATAQGLSKTSDATVIVFRKSNGRRVAARFDVARIRTGADNDPTLLAGDVVVAGKSALKEGFNNFLKALPIVGTFALL